jgi:hypothetical protein
MAAVPRCTTQEIEMNRRFPSTILVALVALVLGVITLRPTPAAALTDLQLQKVSTELHGKRCRMDRTMFDGTSIVAGVDFVVFARYYKEFGQCMAYCQDLLGKFNPRDKKDPRAQKLMEDFTVRARWGNAMTKAFVPARDAYAAALKQKEDAAAAAKARATAQAGKLTAACKEFRAAIIHVDSNKNVDDGTYMIAQFRWNDRPLTRPERLKRMKLLLGETARECAKPAYQDLFTAEGRCHGTFNDYWKDPYWWCEAARDPQVVLAGFIKAGTAAIVKAEVGAMRLGKLIEDEGWLRHEQDITYAELTSLSAPLKKKLATELAPAFAAAGVDGDAVLAQLYQQLAEQFAKRKAEIDAAAPTFAVPSMKPHAATKKAAQLIAKYNKGASIKKHGLSGGWQVTTKTMVNQRTGEERDFPDDRPADGYVLYKMPGEPWCQLRSFTVTEKAKGLSGKYGTASDVTWSFVRLQKCT